MKKVIIESPFSASSGLGSVAKNIEYARTCCLDAVHRGEIPFASHVFFTQFLDDNNPEHRKIGIQMGFEFWRHCDEVVFYVDHGISNGMKDALAKAALEGKPYSLRRMEDETYRKHDAALGNLAESTAAVPERVITARPEDLDRINAQTNIAPGTTVAPPRSVDEAVARLGTQFIPANKLSDNRAG